MKTDTQSGLPRYELAEKVSDHTSNASQTKVVREMLENCYCGRIGELEDRTPVATGDGTRELECPRCGHLDNLDWLPEEVRRHAFEEAERRQRPVA